MATDAIVAIQDMDAAGLTSSSVDMASKACVGIRLELDKVPMREEGMTPYELMLSESQERMLMVLKPGREKAARAIFEKWELDFAVIGRITDTGRLELRFDGATVADIPVAPLVECAPLYDRPWEPSIKRPALRAADVPAPADPLAILKAWGGSPPLASRTWTRSQSNHLSMA